MNNVYASFRESVLPESFVEAFQKVNNTRFNGSLVITVESKSGSTIVTLTSKEKDYKLINLVFTLDPVGHIMEWTQGQDALLFWLKETVGHMVASMFSGMVTHETDMEQALVPSFNMSMPTFSDYLKSKHLNLDEYVYLTPPSLELVINKV